VPNAVVVAGNPKLRSRTLDAASRLATALNFDDVATVDVITLGEGLFSWGDQKVNDAKQLVADAQFAVFASPTFKGTYSGLLKLFLDHFDTTSGLYGVVAVPLMIGASPSHALAPELTLKPVLVELGATCPTPALYQLESTYECDPHLDPWIQRWSPVIHGSLRA